jgi:DNA-binding NarL/FixJ family response regulator
VRRPLKLVLTVSQQPILVKGLECIIGVNGDWQMVTFSGATTEMLDAVRREQPDVLLIDFDPCEHFGPILRRTGATSRLSDNPTQLGATGLSGHLQSGHTHPRVLQQRADAVEGQRDRR